MRCVTLQPTEPFRTIGGVVRKVSVVVTDDLDGSQGAETVAFGLDGASYKIDLGPANRDQLALAFAPFIAAGRQTGRGTRLRGSGPASGPRIDRAAVRAWAREAGLTVSERGRISAEVMRQYNAAD